MTIKISIIVPVYNVEKYLPKCLDSLINQTLKDIEIICINDSSPDNSLMILEDYASKDNRVVVHTQPNQGQGKARNFAMDIAKGEYITFLDSDDWIDLDFCEKLYENAKENDAEIVFGNCIYHYPNDELKETNYLSRHLFANDSRSLISVEEKSQFIKAFICWGKIYKTEFIKKHNFKFNTDYIYEDVPFVILTTLLADKIIPVKDTAIYYRQREDSIMNPTKDDKRMFAHFPIFDVCENEIDAMDIDASIKARYKLLMNTIIIEGLYVHIFDVPEKYREEYFNMMKDKFSKFNIEDNPFATKRIKKFYHKIADIKGYKDFKQRLFFKKAVQSIFSIEKQETKKIINICGLKMKLMHKPKKNNF